MNELTGMVSNLLSMVQQRLASGVPMPDELKLALAQTLNAANRRIDEMRQQQQALPPVTDPVRLVWILAGGNPGAFVQYLRSFPDPELNSAAANTPYLRRVLEILQSEMPQGRGAQADGIPQAALQSSNVYGFQYDPKNQRLLVRFNSGSVYSYDGVPPGIYQLFASGAIPAKTEGSNEWGRWWVGKMPSLGAAFYELIRKQQYPYQRVI